MHRVYVGYDSREPDAFRVAVSSLHRHAPGAASHVALEIGRLRDRGLIWRPTDPRQLQSPGGLYDLTSAAYCSTEFAFSRFLVPALAVSGWALFADCDVLFHRSVAELFALADPQYAVMVVKHDHQPTSGQKMDGMAQVAYPRKNWSSVVLWNCDHPSNRRLSIHDINTRTGADLHRFYWLADSEIGELPAGWNWLVGEQERPDTVGIAHYTTGGPWIPGWLIRKSRYAADLEWKEEYERCSTTAVSFAT